MSNIIIEEKVEKKIFQYYFVKFAKYFISIVLTVITPVIITMFAVYFIGESDRGMAYTYGFVFGILGILSVNISLSYIFYGTSKLIGIYSGVIVTIVSIATTYCSLLLSESYLKWLFYSIGFFAIPLIYILFSILSWELIDKYLPKRELRSQEVEELN